MLNHPRPLCGVISEETFQCVIWVDGLAVESFVNNLEIKTDENWISFGENLGVNVI